MATLYEYYLKDFSRLLSTHLDWTLNNPDDGNMNVTVKVHLDFDSNIFFLSFFLPRVTNEISIFNFLRRKFIKKKRYHKFFAIPFLFKLFIFRS